MKCIHNEWTWTGKPLFIGNDEVSIPIKCDICGKRGSEILKCDRIEWR